MIYKDIDINEIEKRKKDQELLQLKKAPTNMKVSTLKALKNRSALGSRIRTFSKKNSNRKQ